MLDWFNIEKSMYNIKNKKSYQYPEKQTICLSH